MAAVFSRFRAARPAAWLGAAGLSGALVLLSCSAPAKGALVLAISTDMQIPKDIDVVSVYITTNGAPKFDYLGRVAPDGTVSIPATLAVVEPDNPSDQVRIRVIAFQTQANGDAKARVLRDVLTTVPHQRTALLSLPLSFLDDGSGIGTLPGNQVPGPGGAPEGETSFDPTQIQSSCDFSNGQTSVDGVCVSASVDSSTLADYSDALVFGDGGSATSPACFNVATCFAGATPVAVTTAGGACSFPLPQSASASNLGVAIATSGSGATGVPVGSLDVVPLESDAQGGMYSVAGGTVTLVPGVCAKLMLPGASLVTSEACLPKVEASPLCETPGDAGTVLEAGPEAEAGCTPNAVRCSSSLANTPEKCDASGTWQAQPACVNQACVSGACTGSCTPGATTECADRVTPSLCDPTGTWQPQAQCSGSTPWCFVGACVATFPSCQGGGVGAGANCGASGSADCCASPAVTGGTFNRDNTSAYPATVASFRLDAYEVTVGRFRKFVNAVTGTTGTAWVPAPGSGKHAYLPGGGLVDEEIPDGGVVNPQEGGTADGGADAATASPIESGWDPAWETLPTSLQGWTTNLVCDSTYATWTVAAGTGDALPINCVTWAEAEAFCIWDGGFLPSEAEWSYVATGGSMQLLYPWGSQQPGADAKLAVYGCYYGATGSCTGVTNIAPVGSVTAGNQAQWGQSDMAGNLDEWLLDWFANPYTLPSCTNCADTLAPSNAMRAFRGGSFYDSVGQLTTSNRSGLAPADIGVNLGFRCARAP